MSASKAATTLEDLLDEAVSIVYQGATEDELHDLGPVRPWVLKLVALRLFENPSSQWVTAVRGVTKQLQKRFSAGAVR